MKSFIIAICALAALTATAQKKYHATIFDTDNNIVARGVFQTVNDSSLIVLVESLPVEIRYNDINLLKIEKNGSGIEFSKLGSSLATGLIDGVTTPSSTDSTTDSTRSKPFISQENKEALLKKADMLLQQLLDGMDDVASFTIAGSLEKFGSKLKLMREYSYEEEPEKKQSPKTMVVGVMIKPAIPKTKSPAVNGTIILPGHTVTAPSSSRPPAVTVPTTSGIKKSNAVAVSSNLNKH